MERKQYFMCGIGGSGMLPLALILKAQGHAVEGSDRALDQGRTAPKFDFLRARGIGLYPQDGSGVVSADQIVVASAAVESTVPDIVAARRVGAKELTRAALLSSLFNAAPVPVGVAGTSGKSTTTGMIGWILHHAGKDPTVMNGAVMKNFVTPDALFASALVGESGAFVSEVDESDGSIAAYNPKVAVVTNISLDHKSLDELRALFLGFAERAGMCVLNLDNGETAALAAQLPVSKLLTYAVDRDDARFGADGIEPQPFGVSFDAMDRETNRRATINLKMPGRHNVSNALAAIAAASACGVPLTSSARALDEFQGVKRRLDFVGARKGVTVIDDFGHNPDKITASLRTLHEFPGRLIVMFQPHGFGPLRKMKNEFIECFADNLGLDDILVIPEPVYFGGTVDRTVSSRDIIEGVVASGRRALAFATRAECGDFMVKEARTGDRLIIMGARDDTLSVFAAEILERIANRPETWRT